eukprot:scaffold1172_cov409-Prasinococcus_capsulatus_cf.AAC.1
MQPETPLSRRRRLPAVARPRQGPRPPRANQALLGIDAWPASAPHPGGLQRPQSWPGLRR